MNKLFTDVFATRFSGNQKYQKYKRGNWGKSQTQTQTKTEKRM